MAIRLGRFIFLGLFMGYVAALLLSRSTWLEMRFNTSLVILLMTVLGGAWGFLKKNSWHKAWFFGSELLLFILFMVIYHDMGALTVIPAVKLKEAFFLGFLSLPQINVLLLLLLGIGNVLWFMPTSYN
jgi:hypothetical protein